MSLQVTVNNWFTEVTGPAEWQNWVILVVCAGGVIFCALVFTLVYFLISNRELRGGYDQLASSSSYRGAPLQGLPGSAGMSSGGYLANSNGMDSMQGGMMNPQMDNPFGNQVIDENNFMEKFGMVPPNQPSPQAQPTPQPSPSFNNESQYGDLQPAPSVIVTPVRTHASSSASSNAARSASVIPNEKKEVIPNTEFDSYDLSFDPDAVLREAKRSGDGQPGRNGRPRTRELTPAPRRPNSPATLSKRTPATASRTSPSRSYKGMTLEDRLGKKVFKYKSKSTKS